MNEHTTSWLDIGKRHTQKLHNQATGKEAY